MKHDADSVKEYLEIIERKAAVKKIVSVIHKNAPQAKESFEYAMPFYTYEDPIFAIASQKNSCPSILLNPKLVKEFKSSLGKVSMEKNCIHFKSWMTSILMA